MLGGSFDPLSQSEHGAVRGIQRSDSSLRSHNKSPLGFTDIAASTSTASHQRNHSHLNVDLLSQSEHGGGGYQRMSSHQGRSSNTSSCKNDFDVPTRKQSIFTDNSGGDNVGGSDSVSANTAYVNNLPRRSSSSPLIDALSKSDHGYVTKGQGLGMGVTSMDRRPGSSMRSIQRLKGQELGLALEAPGSLPALSFALPKQDKVLTRSSTISTAVLSTFDQVHITSVNTSPH